jgi:hypothetical protein
VSIEGLQAGRTPLERTLYGVAPQCVLCKVFAVAVSPNSVLGKPGQQCWIFRNECAGSKRSPEDCRQGKDATSATCTRAAPGSVPWCGRQQPTHRILRNYAYRWII